MDCPFCGNRAPCNPSAPAVLGDCVDCSSCHPQQTVRAEYHIKMLHGTSSTCAFECAKHSKNYSLANNWIVEPVTSKSPTQKSPVSGANVASYVGPEPVCIKTECVLLFGAGTSINHVKDCKWVAWNEARKAPKIKPVETLWSAAPVAPLLHAQGAPPASGTGKCSNCRDTGWYKFWETREYAKAVCTGGHDVIPCPACGQIGYWAKLHTKDGRKCCATGCTYQENVAPIPSSWFKQ